jgi:hypothetical protein
MFEEEKKSEQSFLVSSASDLNRAQDDFFYKIIQLSQNEFKIEVPSTKKKYIVMFDPNSEIGFSGLPFEWERYFKEMKIRPDEVAKSPLEVLLCVNFIATQGF